MPCAPWSHAVSAGARKPKRSAALDHPGPTVPISLRYQTKAGRKTTSPFSRQSARVHLQLRAIASTPTPTSDAGAPRGWPYPHLARGPIFSPPHGQAEHPAQLLPSVSCCRAVPSPGRALRRAAGGQSRPRARRRAAAFSPLLASCADLAPASSVRGPFASSARPGCSRDHPRLDHGQRRLDASALSTTARLWCGQAKPGATDRGRRALRRSASTVRHDSFGRGLAVSRQRTY